MDSPKPMPPPSKEIAEEKLGPSPQWEAFKQSRPSLETETEWIRHVLPQHELPQEVQTFQDDASVPEKLRQILAWSLNPSPPQDRTAQQNSSVAKGKSKESEHDRNSSSEISRVPSSEAGRHHVRTTKRTKAGTVSGTSRASNSDASSSTSGKLPTKARAVGHRAFESTRDIFSSIVVKAKGPPVECTGCFEEISPSETAKLPCTHHYCKECLTTLIITALQNEATFPPKCCLTAIPLKTVLLHLTKEQRQTYKEKAAEYAIPPQERLYCPNTNCLRWISPSAIRRDRQGVNHSCPHCSTKICGACHGLAHKRFTECPKDSGLEATILMAELEGWRRCYMCRTIVERNDGCRHMTCKCGGEFCYICGAVWQTCHCTEDDELVRQEELRQRREQQQGESAEIARAIAEVEALERIEAERRQQEEREEEERRQAELARLEAERLREEEARRREELRLEREFRKTLRISVEQACEALQSALEDVLRVQRTSLDSRHINLEKQYFQRCNAEVDEQQTSMETMMTALESHISGRIKALEESHEAELRAFDAKLQELEDDFFLEMQTHLRGKSDREGRERRLQDRFNKQQDAKREDIFGRQESEMEVVKAKAALEVRGLTRAQRQQVASLQATHATQLKALLAMVAADRAWYDFLSERRLNMVTEHTRLMLEAVGAGQEPVGLTEERAMAIRPFIRTDGRVEEAINDPSLQSTNRVPEADQHLPSHQKAPSSRVSTPSPSESLVDLVNTSRCLLNILEVHSNAELSHQASLDRARAWVAKTSGEVPLRQVEPRPKGSEPSQASGSGSRSNNSRVAAKPSTGEPMRISELEPMWKNSIFLTKFEPESIVIRIHLRLNDNGNNSSLNIKAQHRINFRDKAHDSIDVVDNNGICLCICIKDSDPAGAGTEASFPSKIGRVSNIRVTKSSNSATVRLGERAVFNTFLLRAFQAASSGKRSLVYSA
ncbi:hypothetical protein HRR93_003364 [Exophiala dermatitidis]|nr:hypothetical protein HRR93_003364 [Exophiala dermatitidis]